MCAHVDPDPNGRRVPDALARAGIRCFAQGPRGVGTWCEPFARRPRAIEGLRTDPTTADAWVMDEADATIELLALPIELPKKQRPRARAWGDPPGYGSGALERIHAPSASEVRPVATTPREIHTLVP